MNTQVQAKDGSPAKGKEAIDEATELPFDIKAEADLERLFDEHPQYLEEFNKDPKLFIEKYGDNPEKKKEKSVSHETQPPEEPENWLEEEKPEGPKAKKPEEKPAVDPQIEKSLKETNEKLLTALREIEELKKGSTKEDKKKIESELKGIDLTALTDLPEDVDFVTEEGQAQAKNQFKSLTKALKEVAAVAESYKAKLSEIESIKTDVGSVKNEVETVKTKTKENELKQESDDNVVSEFKTLDALVSSNKDIFGEKVRPVKAIEDDYLEGIKGMLEKVAGSKAQVVVDGRFSKEALTVLELYNGTTEKAKRFQAKCKELDVGLPEDIDVLNKVYEIRGIRTELSAKDAAGNIINMPDYERAVENYKGRHIGEFRVKDRVENRTSHEKALANRRKNAPETKPGAAPGEEEISNMPADEVTRILSKTPKERTAQERELAFRILTFTGTSERDARELSGLDLKE